MNNGIIVAERYIIEKSISNSGGMASTYLASLLHDSRLKVAIKFARTGNHGPEHEDALLQREADLLSRWDWRHPGIVRLYPTPLGDTKSEYCLRALNVADQPWYMVMEYLSGGSLSQNAKKIQSYPLEWKLEMFYQVLTAVGFIHQKGYGHRDLKPENIVFRRPIAPNEMPQPVLIDFALASDGKSGSPLVETSYTLEYASPERVALGMGLINDCLDPRKSDVWSLGIMLYELLTGELPIKGDMKKIRTTLISRGIDDVVANADYTRHMNIRRDEAYSKGALLAQFIRKMVTRDLAKRLDIKALIYAFEEYFYPPRIPSK